MAGLAPPLDTTLCRRGTPRIETRGSAGDIPELWPRSERCHLDNPKGLAR